MSKLGPLWGVASDLHMDFGEMNPEFFDWRGDVLLLAGDLAEEDKLRKMHRFWERAADMAAEVYYTPGNHEYYGSEIDTADTHLHEFLSKYPNVRLLQNEFRYTNGVALFGGTFWTDLDRGNPLAMWDVQRGMNDYKHIRYAKGGYRPIKPIETRAMHQLSLEHLSNFFMHFDDEDHSTMPVVVMTHHGPSYQSISRAYVGDKLNGGYVSNLDDFIFNHPQIKAWVHGHVHTFKDYYIGECRVMVNARGYPDERPDHLPPYEVHPFRIDV